MDKGVDMNNVMRIYVRIALFLLMLFHGAAWASDTAGSPFGLHPARVAKAGYADNGFIDAQNIGIKWGREGVYAFWFLVQPDLNSQTYDFSRYDLQYGSIPAEIKIMANIAPQGNIDEGYCLPGSYLPIDEAKYIAFVKATVERYDGDGVDDMPDLTNPIKYWQVGNEPSVFRYSDFARLQQITYTAIKEACPDCQVLIGGATGMPPVESYIAKFDEQYKPILDESAGNYVDIMDFHWYGNATGDYRGAKEIYNYIRSVLNADGFPQVPIWITEMGSYSGDPVPVSQGPADWPPQTEREQALDYFKRFIHPLSFGVKKIFAAFGLIEGFKFDGGYFDNTGLIYDGWDAPGETPCDLGLGVKKLGYYTYKKMTGMLEGSDWDTIQTISESDDVYIFRVSKNGKSVHIVWWDYFDDPAYVPGATKQVALSGLPSVTVSVTEVVPDAETGAEITDYQSAFTTTTEEVVAGNISINIGDSPVIVETIPDPPSVIDYPPVTANSSVTLCGMAEAGATIAVMIDSSVVATSSADTSGNWCVSVPLSDGANNLGITAKDQAGNESSPMALTIHRVGSPSMQLIKTITLTTDAEGGSARPEIIATANRVFVLYLGNIGSSSTRTFDVKIFDSGLDTLISQKSIVSPTADYGSPTDIRIASDGQYLYAFYETTTVSTTYLWGAKYMLDDGFERVAYTSTPIASSLPEFQLQDGGEILNDPAPLVGPDSVFVITRLMYSISMSGQTIYRVREFSKNDFTQLSQFDLDLSNVADGRGRVASLLHRNNNIYMALATTVSDQGIDEDLDDSAQSDLRLVIMNQDWTFDPGTDALTLSAEANDRENYVSGFESDGAYYYINYKQAVGSPPTGEQRAVVRVFDKDFNLVLKEQIRSIVWGPDGGEMRSSIEVAGNSLFSGQTNSRGLGTGNAEIYVYDISGLFGTYLEADFSSSTISGAAPMNITFADFSLGSASSWLWDFGDGSTSTEQNPGHVYESAGVYTVSLTVSNGTSTNTVTRTGYITVQSCPNPAVRVAGATPVYYSSLQAAYDDAADVDRIHLISSDIAGDFLFNRDISVTLDGGYDCDYTTKVGITALTGTLTISSGTVIIESLALSAQ